MLRNQNSGADVHQLNNIRHRCTMLLVALEDKAIEHHDAYMMCLRIEDEIAAFFIKKYAPPGWTPPPRPKRDEDPSH